MAQFESWFSTTLANKLEPTATTIEVATAPTATSGRMFMENWKVREWIKYTGVSGTTLTGVTRWLSSTADPATAGTGLTWKAGTEIVLVKMHDQHNNRQEPIALSFADETARDSALWGDGVATEAYTDVYTTAEWFYRQYNLSSNQWEEVDTGTPTPNASETVAGKLEVATDAEVTADTDIGTTGAFLSAKISQLKALFSFSTSLTSVNWSDKIPFQDISDSDKTKTITKDNFRETLAATEASKWTSERADTAEATAGTDDERYMTPKKTADNYTTVTDSISDERNVADASGSVNYSHSLWVAPKAVMITAFATLSWTWNHSMSSWSWSSNGNQKCSYIDFTGWAANGLASEIIYIDDAGWQKGSISAVSDTNITIDWTKIGSETGTMYFTITLFK